MSVKIGELATTLTVKTAPFEKGTRRASSKTKAFKKEVESNAGVLKKKYAPALGKVTAGLAGPAGIAVASIGALAAIKKVGSALYQQSQAFDKIGKLSSRVGVSTEDLTALEFIAGQTGSSFEQMTKGIEAFSKRTGEAAMGTGEAVDAFEALGINVSEFLDLPLIERLKLIADRIKGMSTQSEQAAIAAKLFSRVGQGPLLNMLQLGGDGIELMTKRARQLGIVMGDDVVKALERTNDTIDRFSQRTDGVTKQLTGVLMPAIGAALEDMEKLPGMEGKEGRNTGRAIVDTTVGMMQYAGLPGNAMSRIWKHYLAAGDQMVREESLKRRFRESKVGRDYRLPQEQRNGGPATGQDVRMFELRELQRRQLREQEQTNQILRRQVDAQTNQTTTLVTF